MRDEEERNKMFSVSKLWNDFLSLARMSVVHVAEKAGRMKVEV